MKTLEKEMGQLNDANLKLTDEQFVTFLLTTFPPKHKENFAQLTIKGSNTKKRFYMRLSSYYHPDRVNKAVHGQRYKILSEENAKIVNSKYVSM